MAHVEQGDLAVSKNLDQRVEDVLDIAREYYPDRPAWAARRWEREMKAALAQVFLLGMGVGWDKCVASMDNTFRDLTDTTKCSDQCDHGAGRHVPKRLPDIGMPHPANRPEPTS